MTINFYEPLAFSKNYPEPTIKGLPTLHFSALNFRAPSFNKKTLNNSLFTQNARNGLSLIAKQIKLDNTQSILLPAYHCPALVEPFIATDVEVIFYHLNNDLSINMEDFKRKLKSNTTACVIVRFFGFERNTAEEIKYAKKNNLLVIEDWAHCFFGQLSSDPTYHGDFSVSSCNKFFPTVDGGVVWGLNKDFPHLTHFSWKDEITSFLGMYPVFWKKIAFLKNKFLKQQDTCLPIENTGSNSFFRYFNPRSVQHSCMRLTKWIVYHSDYHKIIHQRQANYRYLATHLSNLKTGTPLYPELGNNIVPYVFPFVLNNDKYFNIIRNKGLMLFRWEELAKTDCTNSNHYRTHLIQIPCHQDLTHAELEKIVNIIKSLE